MNATVLDLDIMETHNTKTIGILDISVYDPAIAVQGATLEVIPPGFNKIAVLFTPGALNILNSNNVGITNACSFQELLPMPDGIWQIRYSIQPADRHSFHKDFMRTTLLECRFQNAFLQSLLGAKHDVSKKIDRKKLQEVSLLIQGAIAAANKNNPGLAMDFYHQASDLLHTLTAQHCDRCPL